MALAFLSLTPAFGQAPAEAVTDRNQVWLGYFNQTRISNKFSFWLDLQPREQISWTAGPPFSNLG